MDYLVDSGGNIVRLDRTLWYFMLALDLVIFIDKAPSLIGRNLALDISFRRVNEVLRRPEPIDILKADGRRPAVGAFASSGLRRFVLLAKIKIHYFAFLPHIHSLPSAETYQPICFVLLRRIIPFTPLSCN